MRRAELHRRSELRALQRRPTALRWSHPRTWAWLLVAEVRAARAGPAAFPSSSSSRLRRLQFGGDAEDSLKYRVVTAQCPEGYYDATRGVARWWDCGIRCPGGPYTAFDCTCACKRGALLDPTTTTEWQSLYQPVETTTTPAPPPPPPTSSAPPISYDAPKPGNDSPTGSGHDGDNDNALLKRWLVAGIVVTVMCGTLGILIYLRFRKPEEEENAKKPDPRLVTLKNPPDLAITMPAYNLDQISPPATMIDTWMYDEPSTPRASETGPRKDDGLHPTWFNTQRQERRARTQPVRLAIKESNAAEDAPTSNTSPARARSKVRNLSITLPTELSVRRTLHVPPQDRSLKPSPTNSPTRLQQQRFDLVPPQVPLQDTDPELPKARQDNEEKPSSTANAKLKAVGAGKGKEREDSYSMPPSVVVLDKQARKPNSYPPLAAGGADNVSRSALQVTMPKSPMGMVKSPLGSTFPKSALGQSLPSFAGM